MPQRRRRTASRRPVVGSTPTAFPEWRFNCTLDENGSKYINFAAYVQGVQIILAGYGYYTVGIDGSFGPGTYTGVRLFQSHARIGQDGQVGKNTWTSLMDELLLVGYYPVPGGPFYRYSSPGVIGINRFDRGDFRDTSGHLYPWSYLWDGFEISFGRNAPI